MIVIVRITTSAMMRISGFCPFRTSRSAQKFKDLAGHANKDSNFPDPTVFCIKLFLGRMAWGLSAQGKPMLGSSPLFSPVIQIRGHYSKFASRQLRSGDFMRWLETLAPSSFRSRTELTTAGCRQLGLASSTSLQRRFELFASSLSHVPCISCRP